MELYIKGNFKSKIYSTDSGFTIGLFKVIETNDSIMETYINRSITFTGNFLELNERDTYIFYGELIEHPKYGYQYNVNHYEKQAPSSKSKIIEFLSSKLFPKVTVKQATAIVDMFGEDTLKIIKENYTELLLVPKMTEKKAKNIYDILMSYNESEDIILRLSSLGFEFNLCLYFYNKYKSKVLDILDNNIYDLIEENIVSFKRIDALRENLNISDMDERRILAGICYAMDALCFNKSNTYNITEEIIIELNKILGRNISIEVLNEYMNILSEQKRVIIVDDRYYLPKYYNSEVTIADTLKYLSSKGTKKGNFDKKISALEEKNNIIYNEKQKLAIESAMTNNVLVITGGPGTGKTTLIKGIIDIYMDINNMSVDDFNKSSCLLAPTGRAAKKISENTSLPSFTIHRFLKWNKEANTFQVNEYNKSDVNFVIIDEVSMIDTLLFESLLKGLWITKNIKLILVGDYNQLPSVGAGQVLKDIIDSKTIDVVNLDLLYRQDNESYIPILANSIKNEEVIDLDKKTNDFCFYEVDSYSIKEMLVAVCNKALEKGYTYKDIQVLCPMYKGVNGIDNINKILQDILNEKSDLKNEIIVNDIVYRENDKVLQLTNIIEENVFNGDIGTIIEVIPKEISENKTNEVVIDFDGNIVTYKQKDFTNIRHAYAISIHKSQGSEFNIIIMPICSSYMRMLYKKLIYTGITRAKKSLILLGSKNVFLSTVNKEEEYIRKTSLCKMLEYYE